MDNESKENVDEAVVEQTSSASGEVEEVAVEKKALWIGKVSSLIWG